MDAATRNPTVHCRFTACYCFRSAKTLRSGSPSVLVPENEPDIVLAPVSTCIEPGNTAVLPSKTIVKLPVKTAVRSNLAVRPGVAGDGLMIPVKLVLECSNANVMSFGGRGALEPIVAMLVPVHVPDKLAAGVGVGAGVVGAGAGAGVGVGAGAGADVVGGGVVAVVVGAVGALVPLPQAIMTVQATIGKKNLMCS